MTRLAVITSLLAVALVGGCTDNYSVIILRNIDPSDTCEVSPSTTVSRGSGFLDVTPELPDGTFNTGYILTPEIRNPTGAPVVSATRPGNPNAHIFYLRGVDVQVLAGPDPNSESAVRALQAAGLANRTILIGGSIEPNGTLGLGFPIIDAAMVQALQGAVIIPAQVVVRVVAFGKIDGTDIESPPFDYPVTLCEGCLLADLGRCDQLSRDVEVPSGGECSPLADGALGCCTTDTGAVCPAVSTMPM